MKWTSVIVGSVLVASVTGSSFASCKPGYVPTDTEGVCQASGPSAVQPSDEKPSFHPQPAYQRGEVEIVNAPNLEAEDRKYDQDKIDAFAEGLKRAGIKKK